MKRTFILLACFPLLSFGQTLTTQKLANDKEIISLTLNKREIRRLRRSSEFRQREIIDRTFHAAVTELATSPRACGQNFAKIFKEKARLNRLDVSENKLIKYLEVLRVENKIDDIFLDATTWNIQLQKEMNDIDNETINYELSDFDEESDLIAHNDVEELYQDFQTYPDDLELCSTEAWINLTKEVDYTSNRTRRKNKNLKKLNRYALAKGIIGQETFKKLEVLRQEKINKEYITLEKYIEVLMALKNIYQTGEAATVDRDSSNVDFTSRQIKRLSDMSQRKKLYRDFNATQIIMIAEIIKRTTRRMGVDPNIETSQASIHFNYSFLNEDNRTEEEVYVLSPSEQYDLSRRMMRQDLIAINGMDSFRGQYVDFSDVITAGIETGHLSLNDITNVITFDDLWNPEISRWNKIKNYLFRALGIATFFIPSPYRYIAAAGMATIEMVADRRANSRNNGINNDNANNLFR